MERQDRTRTVTRRRLLGGVTAVLTGVVAGCSGSDDGATVTTTDQPAIPTATPTSTPELPNVQTRIVQRDRAAITHVNARVSGDVTWPSLTVIDPTQIYGMWDQIDGQDAIQFAPDGEFTIQTSEQTIGGEYRINQGRELLLKTDNGTVRYTYRRAADASGVVMEFLRDGNVVDRYRRRSTPDMDPVDAVQDLRVERDRSETATTQGNQLESGATGSGFFVTPDGYLLTNAHVVLADTDPRQLLFQRLARRTATSLQESLRENLAGAELTDAERAEIEQVLFDKLLAYFGEYTRISNTETAFNVLNGRATPDDDIKVASWEATVEAAGTVVTEVGGQRTWGRDIAVMKVDRENLPSVTLGSSSDLTTGNDLYVIGYPDIGIHDLFEDRDRALEPTLTTGVVSARRTLNSGIETIQTDAAINSGNSGGPMYDDSGEVVGIATFGPSDAGIEDVQFGLPVEVGKTMLDDLGIENRSGEMDTAFDEGIAAYWRGDCEMAVERMDRVLELYPEHPYASQYIEDCESGGASG
ncbi:S1C family serine protease [Halorhabdus amylolytica]|uniref:S1C family serine protease n=1 Tax=Halorhabdus amylolytica TaxID=2559573 RepID=UPI0010AAE88C|nr:trypsin-like peptidase domain-containing protein [Halorhabdus amylolytica]